MQGRQTYKGASSEATLESKTEAGATARARELSTQDVKAEQPRVQAWPTA